MDNPPAVENYPTIYLRERLHAELAAAEEHIEHYGRCWDNDYDARRKSWYWIGVRDGLREALALLSADSEGQR